jgi:hypothetical protein
MTKEYKSRQSKMLRNIFVEGEIWKRGPSDRSRALFLPTAVLVYFIKNHFSASRQRPTTDNDF